MTGKFFWIVLSILIILLIIVAFLEDVASNSLYNNGVCTECGGHYIYQQAVGHRYETNYIYQCDKCGKLIEINSIY